ncbi:hypothetical protein [Herbidospora mongoliensis]|uniref:hypothetical protein n=1 Tax=Herbidospora mongoliensis TaxID=688067 RepID=UPI0012F8D9C1|nr:hypothetical protein [Herbidospora mongoliensis]
MTAGLTVASATASPAIQETSASVAAGPQANTEATPEATADATPDSTQEPEEVAAPEDQDTTPKKVDYAGVVDQNGGLIAISIRNGKVVGYFCDGQIEAWLKGTAEDNTVTLEGKDTLVTAALRGGKAQGRIEFKNKSWRFSAATVKKPSGLYRATAQVRGARVVGGWIKLPNGQSVGRIMIGENAGEAAPAFDGGVQKWYGIPLTPQDPDGFIDSFLS